MSPFHRWVNWVLGRPSGLTWRSRSSSLLPCLLTTWLLHNCKAVLLFLNYFIMVTKPWSNPLGLELRCGWLPVQGSASSGAGGEERGLISQASSEGAAWPWEELRNEAGGKRVDGLLPRALHEHMGKDKGEEEIAWEEEGGGDKQSQCTLRDQRCCPIWAGKQRGAKSWSWWNARSRSPNTTMETMVSHCRVLRQHTIVAALWEGHQGNNI